jgi:hypothetical protein
VARTCPDNGDTVYQDGRKRKPVIYSVSGDTAILSGSAVKNEHPPVVFVRGIGQVGRVFGALSARNLIEYRIGNGPIVKKRWQMKSPDERK